MKEKHELVAFLKNEVLPDILNGKVSSFFLVTTRPDQAIDSDHVSFCGKGDFCNLIGNVEKHKQEIVLKIIRSEDHN